MKYRIDEEALKALNGATLTEGGKPLFVRHNIANTLAMCADPNKSGVKLYELAKKFMENGTVELDTEDRNMVIDVIRSSQLSALVRGQMELALSDSHEVREGSKK
jgi:hypothetical protein